MFRSKWLAVLLTLTLLFACNDDASNNGAADTGAADAVEDTATLDADEDTSDTSVDDAQNDTSSDDASDTVEDVGADVDEDTGGDTADTGGDTADTADAGDPYAGRPIGQCTQDSDCPDGPNGRVCSEALPGGACQGCGTDADCPDIASCSQFGTCVGDCSDDQDCAPGLVCLGSGRCAAQSCVNGECPVPLFGCSDSDRCQRIDCSEDATVCPEDTTCTGGWCIEDRSLQ